MTHIKGNESQERTFLWSGWDGYIHNRAVNVSGVASTKIWFFFLLLGCMHGSRRLKQNPLPNGETKKIVIKDEVGNTIVYSIQKCSGSPPLPLPLLVEDCSCGQDDSLTLIHNVRNEDKSEMVNKKSETALLSFWVAGWNSLKIISVVFSVQSPKWQLSSSFIYFPSRISA